VTRSSPVATTKTRPGSPRAARTTPRRHSPATTSRTRTTSTATKTRPPARAAVAPPLPHGLLAGATFAPSVRKLPFVALGLVSLAIALLALGALPASVVPHPAGASLVATRRIELAIGGLTLLAASIAAYLLV